MLEEERKTVILQGTIEAMSKLPKAAMDAANKNGTKPEESKAADDKLYRYIKIGLNNVIYIKIKFKKKIANG